MIYIFRRLLWLRCGVESREAREKTIAHSMVVAAQWWEIKGFCLYFVILFVWGIFFKSIYFFKFTYSKMHFLLHVYASVSFDKYIKSGIHHFNQDTEHFHLHPQNSSASYLWSQIFLPSLTSDALISISKVFLFPGCHICPINESRWSGTIRLALFSWHNALEIHPCCVYQ